MKLFLGDIVEMRSPHPCGRNRWEVTRVGMDIRIRCLGCGRRLLMLRREFERQMKTLVERPASKPSRDSKEGSTQAGGRPVKRFSLEQQSRRKRKTAP